MTAQFAHIYDYTRNSKIANHVTAENIFLQVHFGRFLICRVVYFYVTVISKFLLDLV